jgi:chromosome segregation protein
LIESEIAEHAPRLATLQEAQAAKQSALRVTEQNLLDWQQKWDACLKEQAEASRWAEVERTKIEYLEKQNLELGRRSEILQAERVTLNPDAISSGLQGMTDEHGSLQANLDAMGRELESRKSEQLELTESQRVKQAELSDVRKQFEAARGRLAR